MGDEHKDEPKIEYDKEGEFSEPSPLEGLEVRPDADPSTYEPVEAEDDEDPGLPISGPGFVPDESPLALGQDWVGEPPEEEEKKPARSGAPFPHFKLGLGLAVVIAVIGGYFFFSSSPPSTSEQPSLTEAAPPAPTSSPSDAAEIPLTESLSSSDELEEIPWGPVEVGMAPRPGLSEDSSEIILTTHVDPSSTQPGGWDFAPPSETGSTPPTEASALEAGSAPPTEAVAEVAPDAAQKGTAEIAVVQQDSEGLSQVGSADEETNLPLVSEVVEIETFVTGEVVQPAPTALPTPIEIEVVSGDPDGSSEIVLGTPSPQSQTPQTTEVAQAPTPSRTEETTEVAAAETRPPAAQTPTRQRKPAEETVQASPPAAQGGGATPAPSRQETPSPQPAEPTKPAERTASAEPAATPDPPAESTAPAAPEAQPAESAGTTPEPSVSEAETVSVENLSTAPPEAIANVWVANLMSTPSQTEADAVWLRLRGHIQDPTQLYRYETEIDGVRYYRIRLGFFDTVDEARSSAQPLSQTAKLSEPWLVRPNVAEVRRFNVSALSNLWAVNISSTPDQPDSEDIWNALNSDSAKQTVAALEEGRDPSLPALKLYRYETEVRGSKQYRIRLGFFASNQEAEQAGRRLVEAANLSASRIGEPWTVRPSIGEEQAYK
ncbi:MAG: hypothetical protein LBJ64_10925 [Deltaproteobacteria bacterium]|nr:hypothetical protein [Deltaproteobacteria bacterium]